MNEHYTQTAVALVFEMRQRPTVEWLQLTCNHYNAVASERNESVKIDGARRSVSW